MAVSLLDLVIVPIFYFGAELRRDGSLLSGRHRVFRSSDWSLNPDVGLDSSCTRCIDDFLRGGASGAPDCRTAKEHACNKHFDGRDRRCSQVTLKDLHRRGQSLVRYEYFDWGPDLKQAVYRTIWIVGHDEPF